MALKGRLKDVGIWLKIIINIKGKGKDQKRKYWKEF